MKNRNELIGVPATVALVTVMIFSVLSMGAGCSGDEKSKTDSNYDKGKKAYDEHRYTESVDYLLQAAEQGDHEAQIELGELYYEKGSEQGFSEALAWFTKAAKTGTLSKENKERAFMCTFFQEAYKGNSVAQYYVFLAYEGGVYIKQDKEEARKWLKKAADSGHPEAQLILEMREEFGLR